MLTYTHSLLLCLMISLVPFLAAGSATVQGTQPEKDLQKSPDARESRQRNEPSDTGPDINGPIMVYDTVIEVDINKSGIATVRETIDTVSHGFTNKSYPDVYPYLFFFRRNVPFEVLEVKRNGKPAPFSGARGERRIFATFGSIYYIKERHSWKHSELKDHYTYTITYKTGLDIHFGKDRDVFSWDVVNEEYIKKARVIFRVPGNPPMELIREAVPEYDVLSFCEWMTAANSRVRSRTTSEGFEVYSTGEIYAGERIVFWISLPNGFIAEPDPQKKWKRFMYDNRGVVYSAAGLAALFVYYALIWFFYGRDLRHGILMPIYNPPAGLSPAAMRFVNTLRFDAKCFAAALISIAVKGHMTIERTGGSTVLRACRDAREDLSADEGVVYSGLFSKGDEVDLGNDQGVVVNRAVRSLGRYLKKNLQKTYLITNFRFFVVGMVITLIFLLLNGWWLSQDREMGIFFLAISFTVSVFSIPIFFYSQYVLRSWWGFWRARGRQKWEAAKEMSVGLFFIPFIVMYAALLNQVLTVTTPAVMLFIVLALLINVLFTSLLKAPTKECRKMRDQISGFRMFLEATEKDRMNMMNPPEKTPGLFTQDLPYALALGIEQKWAEGVEGKVSAELGTLHLGDNIVNKLVAGDPDELYNFLKTSIREDRVAES